MTLKLPAHGTPKAEILARMESLRAGDADWRNGKTFSLVYFAGDELLDLVKQASGLFFSENGLSPIAFPSLKRFEAEVLAMAADLFHGEAAAGTLTSGGSERRRCGSCASTPTWCWSCRRRGCRGCSGW